MSLTKEDFYNTFWQEVINSSRRKECHSYWQGFWKKSQEAQEAGDTNQQEIYALLSAITNAELEPESTEEFFSHCFQNITDEQLNFLAEIVSEISDSELQARIADILWCVKRDYKMAKFAVQAYLKTAIVLEDPKQWNYCVDRIERSLRLAYKINSQKQVVIQHIETVLNSYQGEDPLWLSAKLMELLQEHKSGDAQKYADLAGKAAKLAESSSDWDRARNLWEIKANWHRINKSRKQEFSASMSAAETFVKQAEACLCRDSPSYTTASHFLQRAIQAFRNIRGTKEETEPAKQRADVVHQELLTYQENIKNELISHPFEFDISNLVERARNEVRGKNFQDALFSISILPSNINILKLGEQVKEQANKFILSNFFPFVAINEMGKTVARQPDFILSDNPEKVKEVTHFKMCQNATYIQTIYAQACIEPAREQINLEHSIRIKDVLSIISHSPFVPPGREYLYAKGLYAGLTGDFFTSTHILIPQIENSIRYLLWQKGVIISGLDDSGIQNEHNLKITLDHSEINSLFDESTIFELKCLLIDRAGSNLRNRMAHGLINDDGFLNPLMSYIWWFTLKLCCLPIVIYQQQVEQSINTDNTEDKH
jgi:hypothetical protein